MPAGDPTRPAPQLAPALGRNTGAQLVGRASWLAASLFLTPYLYASLGPKHFGAWALLAGAASLAGLLDLGLAPALVRQVAASGERLEARTREALGLGLLAGALIACALPLAAWLVAPVVDRGLDLGLGAAFRQGLAATAGAAGASALAAPFVAVLDGRLRMDLTAAATVAGSAACVATTLIAVSEGLGLLGPALGLLSYAVVRGVTAAFLCWRLFPKLRPTLNFRRAGVAPELFRFAAWTQATNASSVVNGEADRWILAGVYSTATVAPFEVATKVTAFLRLLPTFFLAALFPAAATAHGSSEFERLDRLYLLTTRYLSLFAAGAAAFLVAGAGPLVTAWIGEPLGLARDALSVLAPAMAFNLCTGGASLVVRAEGRPARETRYALLSVALNVGLTVPLLALLGPLGAAVGSAAAIAISSAYFLCYFHGASERALGPMLRAVGRPWAAATPAALAGLAVASVVGPAEGRAAALAVLCASGGTTVAVYALSLRVLGFPRADPETALRRRGAAPLGTARTGEAA